MIKEDELNKAIADLETFYKALRGLLLELKALDNDKVNALLGKYQAQVS